MNKTKGKDKRRIDYQDKIIQKKNDEIEALESKISKLEISNSEKDELLSSVDNLRTELKEIVEDLRAKRDQYDALLSDVMEMRKVICKELFGSEWRWKVIRWLMRD